MHCRFLKEKLGILPDGAPDCNGGHQETPVEARLSGKGR